MSEVTYLCSAEHYTLNQTQTAITREKFNFVCLCVATYLSELLQAFKYDYENIRNSSNFDFQTTFFFLMGFMFCNLHNYLKNYTVMREYLLTIHLENK